MNTYRVLVREVHIQAYVVEARDEREAKDKVRNGDGEIDEGYFEYSHTLDSSLWGVEIEPDKDFYLVYPETRKVSEATIRGWAEDAIADGEIEGPSTLSTYELALQLMDAGKITFVRR